MTLMKMPPIAAAQDFRNHVLLREVKARCARLGYSLNILSDQPINIAELDRVTSGLGPRWVYCRVRTGERC